MSARTTEKSVGCLPRSSSGNHSSETRTVPATATAFSSRDSTASQARNAEAMAGTSTAAAFVARPHLEAALPSRERQRGIAESDVPAGVASGIFERRGEQHAQPLVELRRERSDGVRPGFEPGGARGIAIPPPVR